MAATVNTKNIKNVCLLGHGGNGKTSLVESMLYLAKETDRLGKTSDGNTVSDYDPEETKRKFSISASVVPVLWKNSKINFLDTPGTLDFAGEVMQSLRVCGTALIVMLNFSDDFFISIFCSKFQGYIGPFSLRTDHILCLCFDSSFPIL